MAASEIRVQPRDARGPTDAEQMKAVLAEEGYENIHTFRDSPGSYYPDHQHPYIEARWLVSGEVSFGANGETFTLQPGDRLDMPANTVHDASIHPEKGATYICASK